MQYCLQLWKRSCEYIPCLSAFCVHTVYSQSSEVCTVNSTQMGTPWYFQAPPGASSRPCYILHPPKILALTQEPTYRSYLQYGESVSINVAAELLTVISQPTKTVRSPVTISPQADRRLTSSRQRRMRRERRRMHDD